MPTHPRREPRYDARLPVRLRSGARTLEAVTGNVSYRGLFVCTDEPPVLRQLITLEATLPGDVVFKSHGMTVFVRPPDQAGDAPPGVGIQFYAQGGAEKQKWESFIEAVKRGDVKPPPLPDPVRRQHRRYAAVLTVKPRNVGELEILYTRDVSKGGMFLSSRSKVPLGTELRLDVHHPDSQAVFELAAAVRRLSPDPPGLGVEFVEMDESGRSAFLEFVKTGKGRT